MQPKQAYGTKPHGGIVAKALEPSPVVSNTTEHHDRLAGAVHSVLKREFKVGDRVRCVAAEHAFGHYKDGDVGTVYRVDVEPQFNWQYVHVNWDNSCNDTSVLSWDYELELIEGEQNA